MAGDGLVRPVNAPSGPPPAPGTQPGTSNAVAIANKVIITGANGELLIYNPSVAAGNLVASGAGAAGTDGAPGNAVLSGLAGYSISGGTVFATQIGGAGLAASVIFYTASSEAGPYTRRGFITGSASGVTVESDSGLTLNPAAGTVIITNVGGLSGGSPITQLDRTVFAAGNTAAATDISNTWSIPAGDGSNGAGYTIETHVTATTGPTTIETLTLGLDLNAGTFVSLATLGLAFNGGALSTTYEIPVRLTLIPGAGSIGTNAQIVLSGPLGDSSSNRLSTNSANMSGRSDTTAFNPANANTVALFAQWGGTGGAGQTAGTRWSLFTRSGQN